MEQVTISRADNIVVKNGEARPVDCSSLPADISVIQWVCCHERGKAKGHIEYVQDPLEDFRPNEEIESFDPYQKFVTSWGKAPTMEQVQERDRRKHEVAQLETMLAASKAALKEVEKAINEAGS